MFPKNTRILIADDMRTMRAIVKKGLNMLGYEDITEAHDGKQAWDEIEKSLKENKPFKLIISDWNMPVMLGIDLLKRVRQTAQTKSTPFVLLTAESEKDQLIEAAKSGVSGYIIKPFTQEVLKEKLQSIYAKLNPTTKPAAA